MSDLKPLFLKKGIKDPDVKILQLKLGGLKADGDFGPATEAALVRRVVEYNRGKNHPVIREDAVVDGYVWHALGLSSYSRMCEVPTEANASRVRPAKQSTMIKFLGVPRLDVVPPVECSKLTNLKLAQRMLNRSVGPFNVTGLQEAVESLTRIFNDVKRNEPELYARLGTAGMLCARAVRGSTVNWSNHSWGTAIDIKIDDMLDTLGDGQCQFGLQVLSATFNAHGWYWGAEFSREDAMHFEAGEALVRQWANVGKAGFVG